MGRLVLVRHGESRWNLSNRFTGWVDVPLSENGVREAQLCARHCENFRFTIAYTSMLARAQSTLFIILSQQDRTAVVMHEDNRYSYKSHLAKNDIPVIRHPALNERHYGLLQGLSKSAADKKYGKKKVLSWRRSFHGAPPQGESLHEAFRRVQPFFVTQIEHRLKEGETILVASHGNTLRAIIKNIDGISDKDISFVDLPHAEPVVYDYFRGKYKRYKADYSFDRPLR